MAPTGTVTEDTIRLACICCERVDGDGLTMADALKAGWQDIMPIDDLYECGGDVRVCFDHLGECPVCYRQNTARATEENGDDRDRRDGIG